MSETNLNDEVPTASSKKRAKELIGQGYRCVCDWGKEKLFRYDNSAVRKTRIALLEHHTTVGTPEAGLFHSDPKEPL